MQFLPTSSATLTLVPVPDDGSVRAGATLRYKDNHDGTITDKNTGLIWEKKDRAGGLHGVEKQFLWSNRFPPGELETIWDWLADLNAEGGTGFAGKSDWRIPNVKELQSIVDYETSDPAVASAFNNNCVASCTVLTCSCTGTGSTGSSYYWSSTTVPQQDVLVWTVGVSWGGMFPQFKTALQADFHFLVRAVRDGCVP